MITATSISGGKTSAYLAANFPTDRNVFSLVCVDDPNCGVSDKKLIQRVNDKLDKSYCLELEGEFIGTAEDPMILNTIFDLEQLLGREIDWVRGSSFDQVVDKRGGWLPNKLHRYCTPWLKIWPMVRWWFFNFYPDPIQFNIGYRANEMGRQIKMNDRLNSDGLLTYDEFPISQFIGSKYHRYEKVAWQKPNFPLIESGIFKDQIEAFWQKFPEVRFAYMNNCAGCFHRSPMLLAHMAQKLPDQLNWFSKTEENQPGQWRSDTEYKKILNWKPQAQLFTDDDFQECESGHCGV